MECKELITLPFYKTDKMWYCSELLGRAQRDLSSEVLEKYDKFRNTGISDKKNDKISCECFLLFEFRKLWKDKCKS